MRKQQRSAQDAFHLLIICSPPPKGPRMEKWQKRDSPSNSSLVRPARTVDYSINGNVVSISDTRLVLGLHVFSAPQRSYRMRRRSLRNFSRDIRGATSTARTFRLILDLDQTSLPGSSLRPERCHLTVLSPQEALNLLKVGGRA